MRHGCFSTSVERMKKDKLVSVEKRPLYHFRDDDQFYQ